MATRLYLRSTTTNVGTLVRTEKSTTLPVGTLDDAGFAAKDLAETLGAATVTDTNASLAQTAQQSQYYEKWISPVLSANLTAQTWTVALAGLEGNANANAFWRVSIYVLTSADAVRGFVYDATADLGTELTTASAGQVLTVTGAAVSGVVSTDRLVVEVWMVATQGMGTAYNNSVSYNGTVAVAAGTADTGSYIETPQNGLFAAASQTVNPTGVATAEALGSPTVTPGSVTASPDGIATAEALGAPTVSATDWIGTDAWVGSDPWPGPHSAGGSAQTVNPTGIASAEAVGTPTVTPGSVTASPTGIASAEALGSPYFTIKVPLDGIVTAEAVGTPTVTPGGVTVTPTGIATAEALGTPTVTPGSVTASPTGIASAEAFGTPTVTSTITVNPTGVATAETLGTPTVTPGPVTASPTGIATAEALGSPTVTISGSAVTLTVASAAHGHTANNPALTQTHVLTVQNALHGHTANPVVLGGAFGAAGPWTRRSRNANRSSSRWIYAQ